MCFPSSTERIAPTESLFSTSSCVCSRLLSVQCVCVLGSSSSSRTTCVSTSCAWVYFRACHCRLCVYSWAPSNRPSVLAAAGVHTAQRGGATPTRRWPRARRRHGPAARRQRWLLGSKAAWRMHTEAAARRPCMWLHDTKLGDDYSRHGRGRAQR